jgi:hypothetical protein
MRTNPIPSDTSPPASKDNTQGILCFLGIDGLISACSFKMQFPQSDGGLVSLLALSLFFPRLFLGIISGMLNEVNRLLFPVSIAFFRITTAKWIGFPNASSSFSCLEDEHYRGH